MAWSSRLFLLSGDDVVYRLAATAFARMLRPDSRCRLPDFASQRVRLASLAVEVEGGTPLGVRHRSYSMLDFDADGVLDLSRLNAQQVARLDSMLADTLRRASEESAVIEAASRFVARGGSWEPDSRLLRSIEAAAMGTLPCRRARVVG